MSIVANDDIYFDKNLYQLVKHDTIDVEIVDLLPTGISGLKQLAGVADETGISLTRHCEFDLDIKTGAVLHTVSSTPAVNLPADTVYYAWEDHVIEFPSNSLTTRFESQTTPGSASWSSRTESLRIDSNQ